VLPTATWATQTTGSDEAHAIGVKGKKGRHNRQMGSWTEKLALLKRKERLLMTSICEYTQSA